ncbi:uncharacterized protein [Panulirus ornatus]|uniref:uncharacterized protein isoform X2 n=1 Tax=Panulirus ornatus TaxID=150431 RepID=UPI003A8BF8F2
MNVPFKQHDPPFKLTLLSKMSTTLFVTCGRGLSTSATQEIKEKIPYVYDIQSLGEGKLSFTINHIPCASWHESSFGCTNEDEKYIQKEFMLNDCNEAAEKDIKFAKKQKDTEYVNAIIPAYNLKLVERIFLLLHCEQFDSDEMYTPETPSVIKAQNTKEICYEKLSCCKETKGFEKAKSTDEMFSLNKVLDHERKILTPKNIKKDYENKLMYIIKNTEWMDIARRVQTLKNYQDLYAGDHIPCQDPDMCPGSVRRVDKQKLREKHRYTVSSDLINNFHYKGETYERTQSFDTTEKNFRMEIGKRRKVDVNEGLKDDISKIERKLNCVSNKDCSSLNRDDKVTLKASLLHDASEINKHLFAHTLLLEKEQVSPEMTEPLKSNKFQAAVFYKNGESLDKISEKSMILTQLDREISPVSVIRNKMVVTPGNCEKILKDIKEVSKPQYKSTIEPWEHSSTGHHTNMSKCEQPMSFRVSCRISGQQKAVLTSDWLTHNFVNQLRQVMKSWVTNWNDPVLDFYVNITNSHFILGLSLAQKSLSLRRYIPHLTVRSTVCYLMAKLSQISPGGVLLDPMCGGGTIVLEAASNFEVSHVIASDLSLEQLEVARCNLRSLNIPVSLINAHAAALPLQSTSVDAVICDFPFGQKYKLERDSVELLKAVLAECQRVLVCGGRAVFLLSAQQHQHINLICPTVSSKSCNQIQDVLTLKRADCVSLGVTSAYVVVLLKEQLSKI